MLVPVLPECQQWQLYLAVKESGKLRACCDLPRQIVTGPCGYRPHRFLAHTHITIAPHWLTSHTEWSSQTVLCGDVYVWRYALLEVHAKKIRPSDRTVRLPLFRERMSNCTNLFRPQPNRNRHRIFTFVILFFGTYKCRKAAQCTHSFTIWQRYM